MILHVIIPPNTTGSIYIQPKTFSEILVNGKSISKYEFVNYVENEKKIIVGSGNYNFEYTIAE